MPALEGVDDGERVGARAVVERQRDLAAAAAAGGEEAAERERARQSAWLADRLQLESEVR